MKSLADAGVRLRVIGHVAGFAPELQLRIHAAEAATTNNTAVTLCVAANYGGRWDVLEAVKNWQAANPQQSVTELTEAALAQHLSTASMPELDFSSARAVSNALAIFCCGKVPMPSCTLPMCCGPTLTKPSSTKP